MFNNSKYSVWYFNIINSAKSQVRKKSKDQYFENHHITPRSLGGDNSKSNLVLLTAKEHYICHLLLPKICVSSDHKRRMVYAFFRMSEYQNKYHKRYTSRLYDHHKKIMFPLISGENGTRYGSTHSNSARQKMSQSRIGKYINCFWMHDPKTGKEYFLNEEDENLVMGRNPKSIKTLIETRRNYDGANNPAFGKTRTDLAERNASLKGQKCWITKNQENKQIFKTEFTEYQSLGWTQGRHISQDQSNKQSASMKGRKAHNKLDPSIIQQIFELKENGLSSPAIASAIGISRGTVCRYIRFGREASDFRTR